MRSRLHSLLWRTRIGRCGPVARALARALRALVPVRGIGPFANMVLGAPRASAACPAVARIGGVSFELDLRQSLHRVVYLRLFSLELRRVVLPLLREDDLFVDVGANFGFWALQAAARGCRAIAVEPVPATRALLAANAARNGLADRVEIVAAALSEAAGTLTLAVPDGESGHASAHRNGGGGAALERIEVAATTLDELVGERQVRFLKIDVEGHEPAVLRGGARVLASGQIDHVLLELTGTNLDRAGASAAELIELLSGHGYAFVRFVIANEGLFPRGSYPTLGLEALRGGDARAGDALWVRRT